MDDEVEQIAGKKIALLLQNAHIHTRKDLANATASKTLKLLVTPQETSNATLKERLASMIEEVRSFWLGLRGLSQPAMVALRRRL